MLDVFELKCMQFNRIEMHIFAMSDKVVAHDYKGNTLQSSPLDANGLSVYVEIHL